MDSRARTILEAFDVGTDATTSPTLSLSSLGDPTDLRPQAEEMVASGWLRSAGAPGAYNRTEDGRLAIAGPLDVTLYTRPGCHLCEEMKAKAVPLIRQAGARLREINIDTDETLRARYNTEVPVLLLGPRKVAKYFLDQTQFQRQLEAAKQTLP